LALRLVLDTNVWLDWLVFDDADVAPLKSAAAAAQVEICIDDACAQELAMVLAYPLRKSVLTAAVQTAYMTECRRIARMMVPAISPADPPDSPLPKCRDADDQKFLELACACRADFLVTRDKLLLELVRRKVRRTPFFIVTPAQLNAAMTTSGN
jgi:putative PIN family toxin of toxin-antitoxin system